MTVMDYEARFTELARFVDDYVATNWAKVRRFENGLKLSIRDRIVGLRLQDMDSMVGTALTIERELGLEVETLKEPLYVSSPLGIRARIGMICRGCELKISGTLLTVDRLTKLPHFLAVRMTFALERFFRLYIREIVRLHGVPVSSVG